MISVLFPFRNSAPTIEEAASSILADMSADDELVAIDDASTDESPSRLPTDRRIVLIHTQGKGIAHALTRGLEASRGDLIARMDADDISLPGRLASSRALLESDPSLGAVATQIETFGTGEGLASYVAWQNAIIDKEAHANAIFVESPICHPSVMMRRTALEASGGFQDPPWPEDWDLWHRMIERNHHIAKVPRVLFRWRRHESALTVTDPRCSEERMRECRAHYLSKRLTSPFAIWGAGQTGRRLARALEPHAKKPTVFIDIDPKKQRARDVEVVRPESLPTSLFVVVAVGAPGARDIVRTRLRDLGRREGADFICAA